MNRRQWPEMIVTLLDLLKVIFISAFDSVKRRSISNSISYYFSWANISIYRTMTWVDIYATAVYVSGNVLVFKSYFIYVSLYYI